MALRGLTQALRPGALPYLGWSGEDNLGDDLIQEAHQSLLGPSQPLFPVPRVGLEKLLRYATVLRAREPRAVLLGGGTVIGRRECEEPLRHMMDRWPRTRFIMLGAGVEDPHFRGKRTYTSPGDLKRWRPILSRFESVTVRGPYSSELLQSIGVDSTVVGDPALVFGIDEPNPYDPDLIAINLADPEDAWGGSLEAAHDAIVAALIRLAKFRNCRFRFVVFNPSDAPLTRLAIAKIRRAVAVEVEYEAPRDRASVEDALAPCAAVIAQRLHAMVMAAACLVPTVAIEYRPKCRDFQASIGMEAFCLRSDTLSADAVENSLLRALAVRDDVQSATHQRVAKFRLDLRRAEAHNLEFLLRRSS